MEASSKNVQAILLALAGFLIFNGADAFLKNITVHYETSFAGLIVILLELSICIAISPWMGGLKPIWQTKKLKLNILRGFFSAFCWLFFILGLRFVDLSINYSMLLSSSLWVAIFCALFFKQNFGLYRWVAIIFGFIGVLVVLRPGTDSFQIATLLPLLAGICFAGASLTARIIGEKEKNITMLFYILFANLIVLTPLTIYQNTWQPINSDHLICLIPMTFYKGGFRKVLKTNSLKLHALRSYFMLGGFLSIIYGLSALPIPTVYVIVFTMPFILNILSMVILKEVVSKHRWFAIVLGIIGVIIALRPDEAPIGFAVLIAAMAPFFSSCGTLTIKFIGKDDHWLSYALYVLIFQTPVLMAIVLFNGGTALPDMSDISILPWIMGGGAAFSFGLTLIPQAVKRIDASVVGSLVYIVFPWGVLYGFFLFRDVVDGWTLLGAAIIIASGLFLIYREHKEHSKLLD